MRSSLMRSSLSAGICLAAAAAGGCGSESSPTAPVPSPTPLVEVPGTVRGPSEGSTALYLVQSDPLPGGTVAGCGTGASGCGGRFRMKFRVVSPRGGPTLGFLAFLHSERLSACFVGRTGAFDLPAGQPRDVAIVFDPADTDEACPVPLDITHVAAVVEGPVETFGRQEWAARFHLAP